MRKVALKVSGLSLPPPASAACLPDRKRTAGGYKGTYTVQQESPMQHGTDGKEPTQHSRWPGRLVAGGPAVWEVVIIQ